MKSEHTKGRWCVRGESSSMLCVVDRYSAYIARSLYIQSRNEKEIYANAYLIAASPLLRAYAIAEETLLKLERGNISLKECYQIITKLLSSVDIHIEMEDFTNSNKRRKMLRFLRKQAIAESTPPDR